jgi:hypothetical protein
MPKTLQKHGRAIARATAVADFKDALKELLNDTAVMTALKARPTPTNAPDNLDVESYIKGKIEDAGLSDAGVYLAQIQLEEYYGVPTRASGGRRKTRRSRKTRKTRRGKNGRRIR